MCIHLMNLRKFRKRKENTHSLQRQYSDKNFGRHFSAVLPVLCTHIFKWNEIIHLVLYVS